MSFVYIYDRKIEKEKGYLKIVDLGVEAIVTEMLRLRNGENGGFDWHFFSFPLYPYRKEKDSALQFSVQEMSTTYQQQQEEQEEEEEMMGRRERKRDERECVYWVW